MISSNSTATMIRSSRVRITRLAEASHCGNRQILLVGCPSAWNDTPYHFFLGDMAKLEADEATIRAVLDYLYWCHRNAQKL